MSGDDDIRLQRLESAGNILSIILTKGVKMWAEGGRLRYEAPRGAITPDELDRIGNLKQEIMALLRDSPCYTPIDMPLVPRHPSEPIPLTFTLRSYWKQTRPDRTPSALARVPVRVIGPLNIDCLQQTFSALVHRHELLRTRIISVDGGDPRQEVQDDTRFNLEIVQMTGASKADRETEAQCFVERHLRNVEMSVGPSFDAALLKIDHHDHVLVIFWQHNICDLYSVGILWRDIWTMYAQSRLGRPFSLPKLSIQPADYAVWEQRTNPAWMRIHGAYWKERLANAQGVQLFSEENDATTSVHKSGAAEIIFDEAFTKKLSDLSRSARSSLMMGLLTVYVALAAVWCKRFDVVVWVTIWGRFSPDVENTVGCFAGQVPLRLQILGDDSFPDLLKCVRNEYDRAHEHAQFSRAQMPSSELPKFTSFTWIPQEYNVSPVKYFNNSTSVDFDRTIRLRHFPFDRRLGDDEIEPAQDAQPALLIGDEDGQVRGTFMYRTDQATGCMAERFVRYLRLFAERWAENPRIRVIDLPI